MLQDGSIQDASVAEYYRCSLLADLLKLSCGVVVLIVLGCLCVGGNNVRGDLAVVLVVSMCLAWQKHSTGASIHWLLGLVCACGVAFVLRQYISLYHDWNRPSPTVCNLVRPEPLRPAIYPCRTTHTRLFPKTHSLSYSYLFVGIPIGWHGPASTILSADLSPSPTWYSVHQEDYLVRGKHPHGLKGKLNNYLHSQGVDPVSIMGAYLVTAPRFLGFSFNPVSFWYLYDSDMLLTYMILEVNNTFDERRMYFLSRAGHDQSGSFNQEWRKDFHVSPFNDREGSYCLTATDPFAFPDTIKVDNTIVLKAPDGRSKLVARVFSTENSIEAGGMTRWQTLNFTLKWCWVGFMTNPRILREARILWVKKLQLYYRPEINIGSIGRNETVEEIIVERSFCRFLQSLANDTELEITYTPAAGPQRSTKQHLKMPRKVVKGASLELEILTPAFYAELVQNENVLDAIKRCGPEAKDGEMMVKLSAQSCKLLPTLIVTSNAANDGEKGLSPNRVRLRSIFNNELRRESWLLTAMVRASKWWITSRNVEISNTGHNFSLSGYVQQYADETERDAYEHASTRLLLARRAAFGSTGLLQFYVSVLRWATVLLISWQLSGIFALAALCHGTT